SSDVCSSDLDIGQKSGQYADGDTILRDLPDAEDPYNQQADFGQQCYGWCKQCPGLIDAIIDFHIALVDCAKTLQFSFFLGKRFYYPYTGQCVCQHIVDFCPDAINFLKTGA